ncbi:pantetheine-phosphate adenylyltransferase family protein [Phlyctema vagabunda]|uniref:Pantetheine-phosphate adenylyltransferase family protein n=1 Tax=Phlyctema vagabunda TaxID=108571 RepID=A0ABR4P5E1_9HELO
MARDKPSLLLLPPPPTPNDEPAIGAAYRPAITATISRLKGLSIGTQLVVAVPWAQLHSRLSSPRSQIYSEAEGILARLYGLISVVCAEYAVDIDPTVPGGVDARIILLDYDDTKNFSTEDKPATGGLSAGPIIDLSLFALTRRNWHTIFSVEGEGGQKVLANYMSVANSTNPPLETQVCMVSGGVSLVQRDALSGLSGSAAIHKVVAVGGTFDHLHAGHKLLLTATALLIQHDQDNSWDPLRIIVGITGDQLLKNKKYAEYMKTWKQRQEDVTEFLLSILSFTSASQHEAIETLSFDQPGIHGRAVHTKLKSSSITIECVEIQDPFGPTITDESVSALVVSAETRSGGQAVNAKRSEKHWKALEVFEVNVLDAEEAKGASSKTEEFASKISSTAIRKQKADAAFNPSL